MDAITGSSGFIGSHLLSKLLSMDKEVRCIDIAANKADFGEKKRVCDIRKPEQLNLEGVDRVFHLAALADIVPSIENPRDYFETNVSGTFNVLEAARKAGVKKFVYAASASCYGSANQFIGTYEEEECAACYPYALTKYLGEQLVMHWSKVYKIPAVSLRLFNVYGPRSRTTGAYGAMFGVFLAQLANMKPLTVVGDGRQQRDFTFVSDVVDAFIKAADSDVQGIYNVGSGSPVSVNRIVELLGSPETVPIPKRPGEPKITCANIEKIKNELGWEPKVGIEDGVKIMLGHLQDYKNATVWEVGSIQNATKSWFEALS